MRQGVLIDDKKWFQCFEYLVTLSGNLPSHDRTHDVDFFSNPFIKQPCCCRPLAGSMDGVICQDWCSTYLECQLTSWRSRRLRMFVATTGMEEGIGVFNRVGGFTSLAKATIIRRQQFN
jgi:hypothetical protein